MAKSSAEDVAPLLQERMSYSPIDSCIAGPGVRLDAGPGTQYEGCRCQGNCVSSVCSCAHAYDEKGRLREEYFAANSRPVFECNSQCPCSNDCSNRSTQRPLLSSLQVFQAGQKGYGVQSSRDIQRGTYIGEYVGEIIPNSEAKRRLRELPQSESCYVVMYREHSGSGLVLTTSIDATRAGNITRFINHSCSPNLTMVPVRVDSIVPRLCLFACKDIAPGEELCFSYFGCSSVELTEKESVQLGEKSCLCGSEHCLEFLPLQAT